MQTVTFNGPNDSSNLKKQYPIWSIQQWGIRCRAVGLLALFCMGFLSSNALHIKGGWITYRYLGNAGPGQHRYLLNLKVYRDCGIPSPGQNDPSINFTLYNGNGSFVANFPANLMGIPDTLKKTTFSECINPRPEVCYRILEYQTEVTLPETPLGYVIGFQRCCRINGIVNIEQPTNSMGNTYTVTIPGTTVNQQHVINSSPEFRLNDTVLVCFNSPIGLDYSALDPDGDSLVYSFTEALMGGGQNNPNPTTAAPPPYNSLPYASGYSAADPFGTGLTINQLTGFISGRSPSITGEYVVAVKVDEYRNGIKIATTRKELHVNVASCNIAAAKLPLRIASCDSYTVQFENQSSSPAILSYYWDFGVPGTLSDTSRNAVPVFTYPDTGVYIAKLIVNRESTCSDSATTEVRVFPGFFPGFKVDGACFANNFVFTDTSSARYGVINSWRWNFGNAAVVNDTSNLQNPLYRYPTPGQYTASLEVSSSKGCIDTVAVVVDVLDRPLLRLGFRDTLICSIDTLQLQASGTGIFEWTPDPTLLNPLTPNPLVFPKTTTTYTLKLSDNGCVAIENVRVNVIDSVTLDAGPDSTICLTDGIAMRPCGNALYYQWQPAGIFASNTLRNAVATPTAALTTIRVRGSVGKCFANDSLLVRAVPYPFVNAGNDSTICYGDLVQFNGFTNGSSFGWSPAALLSNALILRPTARLTATNTFTLTATDTLGCPKPASDVVRITVRPPIRVFAGNDTTVVFGQRLQLNASANAPQFVWTPVTGLSNASIANPTAFFQEGTLPEGTDQVRYVVTASTPEGCNGSDDIVIRVFKTAPSIFIPSAFTPNADGKNDVIRPTLAGVQTFEFFRVYNRYGQLVFETRTPGKGWDGNFNGIQQPGGAFVYQCKAVDYLGNTLFKKGSFVLIR